MLMTFLVTYRLLLVDLLRVYMFGVDNVGPHLIEIWADDFTSVTMDVPVSSAL